MSPLQLVFVYTNLFLIQTGFRPCLVCVLFSVYWETPISSSGSGSGSDGGGGGGCGCGCNGDSILIFLLRYYDSV